MFAVGDRVDEQFGLPYKDGLYLTAPDTEQDPGAAYEVWDPETKRPLPGVFVVGWSRRASDGVVGRAKLDAETGVKRVLAWLATRPKRSAAEAEGVIAGVIAALEKAGSPLVTYQDVLRIEAEERARAEQAGVEELKFKSDEEMLDVLRH